MEDQKNIITKASGSVYEIILNRPQKGNALDIVTIRELNQSIEEINILASIRIVILRGEGKHFCSGADLNWMADAAKLDYSANLKESKELAMLFSNITNSPKLFIARVSGACYGGGVGLAGACDFILAAEGAEFAFSEVRLGLVPATISPYIISRVGAQRAKRLMLTGERKNALQLQGIGLVDFISCENELDTTLKKLIDTLLKGGRQAQAGIKKLIHTLESNEKIDESLIDYTANLIARSRVSEEGKEGIGAFLEKRKPNW